MDIEKASLDDIDALVEMRLAYLREDNGYLEASEEEAIRKGLPGYFQAHLDKDLHVFAIREDQAIVSCAFLLLVEKPLSPAFLNGKTGIVLNVYTRPASRRKGYARQIMEALLAEAKERKVSVIELKATDDGHELYRLVGFIDDHSKYHPMKWVNQ